MNELITPALPSNLVKTTPSQLKVQTADNLDRHSRVAGNILVATDHVYTDAVTLFASYIDGNGKPSTSPGGFKTQVNKRIKAGYGMSREEMSGIMKQHCSVCHAVMTDVLLAGIDDIEPRADIKAAVWDTIALFSRQWQEINAHFAASR